MKTVALRMFLSIGLLLVSALNALAEPAVTAPEGDFAIAYLDLDGKEVAGDQLLRQQLILALRDQRIVSAWAPHDIVAFDGAGVKFDGKLLQGEVIDRQIGEEPGLAWRYKLDASVSGSEVTGKFEVQYVERGRKRTATGAVKGVIKTAEQLAAENSLEASANWPCWRGPRGDLSASPSDSALVDTLAEARRVWKGEEEQPGSPGRTGGLTRKLDGVPKTRISGGGASPVVADGRVIVSYFVPSGDVLDSRAIAELTKKYGPNFTNKMKTAVGADDVVLCLDAATGQTLWKTVFAGEGLNWQEHKTSPNNLSPVVHDGRVYAIGSTLRLNCLDLKTGKPIWQSHLGPKHLAIERAKADGLAKAVYQGAALGSRHLGGAPIIVGGVLVVNDMVADLCGFDLAGGKEIWRVAKVNDPNAPPARWSHQGEEFAIASSATGLTCVRPADGQVQWKLAAPISGADCVVNVAGDHLCCFELEKLGDKLNEEAEGAGSLACYELSLQGAKQLWKIPAKHYSLYAFPHIRGDRVYVSGREQTDGFHLVSGKLMHTARGAGAGNGGSIFSTGDRLLLSQDGKHGETRLMMLNATADKLTFTAPAAWKGPHAHTTAYGHTPMAYPVVDGRIFIRGGDAVYCYDLRMSD